MAQVKIIGKARCAFLLCVLILSATGANASVEISADATKNMNCTAGVCAPTSKNAVLNTTDLANMLATTDVKVTTGNGAVTITVSAPFSWTSTHRLTLDAYYNVSLRAPIQVAGIGAVTIVTNDGGTGGDLTFLDGGKIDFWDLGSSLTVNGNAFALEKNIEQLRKAIASAPESSYALARDFNAAHDSFMDHVPIPRLVGTFEGLGHVVSNLTINAPDRHMHCVGFFGKNDGLIRDIAVRGAKLDLGDVASAGILIGCNKGAVQFSGTDGFIMGNTSGSVGGLVGTNEGIVESSSSSASVSGYDFVGGLVGGNDPGGKINQSHSSGSVSSGGAGVAGGLVGFDTGSGITLSYATGAISGGNYEGGLIGAAEGLEVSQCFATGNINASGGAAGGLAGDGQGVYNSYSTGFVYSKNSGAYGGLMGVAGELNGTSYSLGSVKGMDGSNIGGDIGYVDPGSIFSSIFWDMDTSDLQQGCGLGDCSGVSGLTDTQLKSGLPTGFDPSIWAESTSINNGYPYLIDNPPPKK